MQRFVNSMNEYIQDKDIQYMLVLKLFGSRILGKEMNRIFIGGLRVPIEENLWDFDENY